MARTQRKTNSRVEKKLVGVADVVITAAQRRQDPTLSIPVRSLSNITFNEHKGMIEMGKGKQARSFFNVGMAKKFMQTVLVADALCELQRADLT
ncbi:MAG: DNA topoisomerase IV subunit A, partial [Nitrospiraceae bacterium]